ncbi:MAG TPA: ankyrin repeat domain-containing protein [Bryobacteraceae bacterium]|nr:ankyrin repeat domain-containing protein [Bryobacteraceae bacterium]
MVRLKSWIAIGIAAACGVAFGAQDMRLVDAVKAGDVAAARALIAKKVDVNASDADTSTPLDWAVQKNNVELTDLLIDAGASVNAKTRYNITPIFLAATNGNAAIIERLLKAGVEANSKSEDGETALMTAARNGRVDAIKILLTHGAQVNEVEPYKGQTALMWAAGKGNADAAAMLVEFGANLKAKSRGGYTPLLFAVLNNRIEAAKTLIKLGANIEDEAPDGTTALNMAAVNAYYDLASVLLDLGANPNAADPRGSTLHTLVWLRKPGTSWEAAALAETPEPVPHPNGNVTALQLATKLLAKGANPNAKVTWKEMPMTVGLGTTRNPPNINLGRHHLSFVGATPFYCAARNGDVEFMRLLVDHGADPNINTDVGVTPLMAAAGLDYYEGETPGPLTGVPEPERLEALKLALALGNPINAHTHFGDYPMIGSPEYTLLDYPKNMKDLLNLGVGDPRWDGMTALHGAVMSNQPSLVQFLVDHGAEVDAKNRLGWTPVMITKGIFMANSRKEFPAAAKILQKALDEKGLRASQ